MRPTQRRARDQIHVLAPIAGNRKPLTRASLEVGGRCMPASGDTYRTYFQTRDQVSTRSSRLVIQSSISFVYPVEALSARLWPQPKLIHSFTALTQPGGHHERP
jgi:hypothetical protein